MLISKAYLFNSHELKKAPIRETLESIPLVLFKYLILNTYNKYDKDSFLIYVI